MLEAIQNFLQKTGIAQLFSGTDWWKTLIMYVIIGALFYLAIVKKFEPLLLLPIAFGMLLANLPGAELMHMDFFFDEHYLNPETGTMAGPMNEFLTYLDSIAPGLWSLDGETLRFTFSALSPDQLGNVLATFNESALASVATLTEAGEMHVTLSAIIKEVVNNGGLVDILYLGVKLGIYPSLIFLGIGAMTDFTPLIANPSSLMLGAAAQLGVFVAFFGALFYFSPAEASAIGIIGGADGPTAILVTKILAPSLLGAIAIAAYSYMALIPMIQPPIMRLLTTKKERSIKMTTLRPVSTVQKVVFPILVTLVVVLIVPDAAPLVGFLMLGNLFNVSGVTDRLSKTAQNELINIVTIFLGVSVGATASADNFLKPSTLLILGLGLLAFCISTVGGVLGGKFMCWVTHGKVNPLIGAAGVSAVPMAARVAQNEGRREDPTNFLLMHAMGPNVAGVIGSAVAAGFLLSCFA